MQTKENSIVSPEVMILLEKDCVLIEPVHSTIAT